MKKEKLNIVYEDKELIVVDKPAKMLTISTLREKEKTLYHQVFEYLKQKHKSNKVFIVHRLDRDTSGLVLFAKTEKMKKKLQDNWNEIAILRNYIAVLEGKVKEKSKTIESYIAENKAFISYSSNAKYGKLAITQYELISESKKYSLVNIKIKTGRKNQIRVHMSEMGNPIVGDKKYNAKTNPLNRLGLHANKLIIKHPINGKIMEFESKFNFSIDNL